MKDADTTRPPSPDLRLFSKQLCYLNVCTHNKVTAFLAISESIMLSRKLLKFEKSVIQLKCMLLKVFFHISVPVEIVLIFGTKKTILSPFLDSMGM